MAKINFEQFIIQFIKNTNDNINTQKKKQIEFTWLLIMHQIKITTTDKGHQSPPNNIYIN